MDDPRQPASEQTGGWPALSAEMLQRNWRTLPLTLHASGVRLREVEAVDAGALFALLGRDEIAQVIAPPPASVGELAARINAARLERTEGRGVCFAVLSQQDRLAGLIRVREIEPGFASAEWEFVLSPEQWGTGLFFRAAPLVVDFAFDVLGTYRLEARAAVHNGRGNGALRKIGAIQEGVLRQSLQQQQGFVDQALWTILSEDWRARTGTRGPKVH
jgi:RimJ/RimL family protein N-acetyltransferase